MKKSSLISTVLVISILIPLMCDSASGDDTSVLIDKIARQTKNSFGLVRVKVVDEMGTRMMVGTAICINPQMLMTYAIDPRLNAEKIAEIEIVLPGVKRQSVKATLIGIDPVTGLSFLNVSPGYAWQPVAFIAQSGLKVGDKVVSSGLTLGDAELSRRMGTAYVAGMQRTPDTLVTVTGGTLGSIGSVVFNEQAQAVGIIGSQPFVSYDAIVGKQNSMIPLKNDEFTLAFTPVDEFSAILRNVPQDGKARRMPWIGVQRFAPVQKTLSEAKGLTTPAVMLDQVIPASQAAKAGLQNRDIIVAMDGKPLEEFGTPELVAMGFTREFLRKPIGQKVVFTVVQGDARRDVEMTLLPMPKMPTEATQLFNKPIGVLFREKVPIDRYLSEGPAAEVSGLLVLGVIPNTPADRAGLKKDDIVVSINGKNVTTAEQGKQAIEQAVNNKPPLDLGLMVQRGDKRLRLTIETPER